MAFTGSATIKKVSNNLYRITGLSLGIGANGTISLADGTGAVKVTAPNWDAYKEPGAHGGTVNLNESVQVSVNEIDPAGTTTEPPATVKTGTVPADFLITITNRDAAATGALEIYLRLH